MIHVILVAIATLLGIFLRYYSDWLMVLVLLFAAFVFAFICKHFATTRVKRFPVLANWLLLTWYIVPFIIIVGSTFLATWLALSIPGWLPDNPEVSQELAKAEKRTITGLVLGATNTLIAAILLDNAKDPDSPLWPGELYRNALSEAFKGDPLFNSPRSDIAEALYCAVAMDKTSDGKVVGWHFSARVKRARTIANCLSQLS